MNRFFVLTILSLATFVFITSTTAFRDKNGLKFTNCTEANCSNQTEQLKDFVRNQKDACFLSCQVKGKYMWELSDEEKPKVLECFKKNNCDFTIFKNSTQLNEFVNCATKHCSSDLS